MEVEYIETLKGLLHALKAVEESQQEVTKRLRFAIELAEKAIMVAGGDDHDCHMGPESGCLHPSHKQI